MYKIVNIWREKLKGEIESFSEGTSTITVNCVNKFKINI